MKQLLKFLEGPYFQTAAITVQTTRETSINSKFSDIVLLVISTVDNLRDRPASITLICHAPVLVACKY